MVLFQSMSRGRGRRVRVARLTAPVTADRVRVRIRLSISADDGADDLSGGRLGGLGQHAGQAEQRADQVHVGLERGQHLRFQQQLAQVAAGRWRRAA